MHHFISLLMHLSVLPLQPVMVFYSDNVSEFQSNFKFIDEYIKIWSKGSIMDDKGTPELQPLDIKYSC